MSEPYIEPIPSDPEPRPRRQVLLVPLLVVVALIAAVIGIVSFGGDDGDGDVDPIQLLGSAPDAVRDAGTARMEMSIEGSGEGTAVDGTGHGLVDFESGDSSFEMSMMGFSIEMRTVEGLLYMRMPELGSVPGLDAEWISMPIDQEMAAGANPFGAAPSGTAFVDALRGVSDDIVELGNASINGVDATGYRVSVDLERAAEALPEQQRAQAAAGLEQMRTAGMADLPMEVWVTDDGLPVRMIVEMRQAVFEMSMRMDFTDFGVDVDVEAPPAAVTRHFDDPGELTDLMSGEPAYAG